MQTPYATTFPARQMDATPILSNDAGVGYLHAQLPSAVLGSSPSNIAGHGNQPSLIASNGSQPSLIASNGDLVLQSNDTLQKENNAEVTLYHQGNSAHVPSPHTGSKDDDLQNLFFDEFNFRNPGFDDASPGMMFTCASPWQTQNEAVMSSFNLMPETFKYEDGLNATLSDLIDHVSNAPPQFSSLVDIYPMMGAIPGPARYWDHESNQVTENSSIPMSTSSNRRTAVNSLSKVSKVRPGGDLKCEWPGCHSSRPFGRLAELERHRKTFHTDPRTYGCGQEGCMRTFRRKDKLQEHIRKSHSDSI